MRSKKALVVDDSALVRRFIRTLLEQMGFEVDIAKDGKDAIAKAIQAEYDLITLDIEMPIADGFEVLQEVMKHHPTRVLVISSHVCENGEEALKALELGALDYIQKPDPRLLTNKEEFETIFRQKVQKIMEISKVSLMMRKKKEIKKEIKVERFLARDDKRYVLIGASTGGPKLIEAIARTLPADYPYPICVVQHMPTNFTGKFAQRLDSVSKLKVLEATQGEELTPGKMIIGKGGKHLHFRRDGDRVFCKLVPNSMKRFFVPSVDEMFFSALEAMNPKNILAVLLTGIGDDGADGMVALKKAGAYTIAESEESATVYGMPKEAYVRGGTVKVLDFDKILEEIVAYGSRHGIEAKA